MSSDNHEADLARRVWQSVTGAPGARGTRDRWDRPVRNGRWYLLGAGVAAEVGWGDMTLVELRAVAGGLPFGWTFVVLPEHLVGGVDVSGTTAGDPTGRNLRWYDWPDHPRLRVSALAESATFVAAYGNVRYVDRTSAANRAGNVWLSPGYRLARTGRVIPAAKVLLPAVTPQALREELLALVGSDRGSVYAQP